MTSIKTINVPVQFAEMAAYSILKIAAEHKKFTCIGEGCNVTLFPLRSIIEQLLDRQLSHDEIRILS